MSIYASIPGIGDPGDDEALGQPWIYQGSHVLPAAADPRGGSIGLAIIPSHITRDGRDDQPEDGRPWPWLRLSVDAAGADPTVLLNPAQARHHGAQVAAWADEADPQLAVDGLRERYATAIEDAGVWRPDAQAAADAVLAVRDEELARLRAELTWLQEAGDHHIDGAERERDEVREQLAEARSWARHGYEIGQRSCTWSDYGVAPAWLTEECPLHSEPPAEETTTEVARADARYWDEKDAGDTDPHTA